MTKTALGTVCGVALLLVPKPAAAFVMHDAVAFGQRALHLYQQIVKFREMVTAANNQFNAFKEAYKGAKNWKDLSWQDTLAILDSPWLDGVEGIDELRFAVTATVMTAEQAGKLFNDVKSLGQFRDNPRYRTDPWYRAQVDRLLRNSGRARAQKIAIVRMLQAQNRQLIEDTERIGKLRAELAAENDKAALANRPVNQARIASLHAAIAAIEARYQGQEMMLKNQQLIMHMVGRENAQQHYIHHTRSEWINKNTQATTQFGLGFTR